MRNTMAPVLSVLLVVMAGAMVSCGPPATSGPTADVVITMSAQNINGGQGGSFGAQNAQSISVKTEQTVAFVNPSGTGITHVLCNGTEVGKYSNQCAGSAPGFSVVDCKLASSSTGANCDLGTRDGVEPAT